VKLDLRLARLTERKHTYLVCGTLGRTLVASEHLPSQLSCKIVGETAIFKELAITVVSPFIHVRSRACAISVAVVEALHVPWLSYHVPATEQYFLGLMMVGSEDMRLVVETILKC